MEEMPRNLNNSAVDINGSLSREEKMVNIKSYCDLGRSGSTQNQAMINNVSKTPTGIVLQP